MPVCFDKIAFFNYAGITDIGSRDDEAISYHEKRLLRFARNDGLLKSNLCELCTLCEKLLIVTLTQGDKYG